MKRRIFVTLASLLAVCAVALVASAKLTSVGAAQVRFLAVGPGGLKINGKSSQLSATEAGGKLKMVAPVTNLKTGIGLRDKHLRKYLEAKKHPNATLVVDKGKLKMPPDKKAVTSSARGKLTLHGVTKPVKFEYKAKRTGSDYHVQGKTRIDIRHFDIEVPCYLGVCVEPQVKIKVKFKLRDK